ncbi:hypothetical protein HY639_00760 [Candidatus Woesearchaeota archaeon]|nr:hypothetical protein [Candidatus Woesearchaeota archaeon]
MQTYYSLPVLVPVAAERSKRYTLVLETRDDMVNLRRAHRLKAKASYHPLTMDLSDYIINSNTMSSVEGIISPLLPVDCVGLVVDKYAGLRPTEQQLVKLRDKTLVISNKAGVHIKGLADVIDCIEPTRLESFLGLLDLHASAKVEEVSVIFRYLWKK